MVPAKQEVRTTRVPLAKLCIQNYTKIINLKYPEFRGAVFCKEVCMKDHIEISYGAAVTYRKSATAPYYYFKQKGAPCQ